MKKTLIIVMFSILLSFACWGKWVAILVNSDGNTVYVEDESIKKIGKYVYYWEMEDFLKRDEMGDMSYKNYKQVDCKTLRFKVLQLISYIQSMGKGGISTVISPPDNWIYPPPNSSVAGMNKVVCDHAN